MNRTSLGFTDIEVMVHSAVFSSSAAMTVIFAHFGRRAICIDEFSRLFPRLFDAHSGRLTFQDEFQIKPSISVA